MTSSAAVPSEKVHGVSSCVRLWHARHTAFCGCFCSAGLGGSRQHTGLPTGKHSTNHIGHLQGSAVGMPAYCRMIAARPACTQLAGQWARGKAACWSGLDQHTAAALKCGKVAG